LAARVRGLVFLQELVAEVVHELADLFLVPLVFALDGYSLDSGDHKM